MSTRHPVASFVRTAFSFFGYTNLVLAWLWVGTLVLPGIVRSGVLDWSKPEEGGTPTPVFSVEPSLFTTVIAIAITAIVLTITVIVLFRLPKVVTRSADKVIHSVSEAAIPVVTHHRPLPAKKKIVIGQRLTLAFQLLLFIPPIIGAFFVPTAGEVSREIIMMMTLILSMSGGAWFVFAYLLTMLTSRTRSRASRG